MSENQGHTEIRMGSDRSFGLVIGGVFLIIALWPVFFGGSLRWWAAVIAAGFGGFGLVLPSALHRLNVLWFKFGMLLSRIVSPIVMGILFFLTVTPVGLIMRIFKPDLLKQKFDPDAKSYWIEVDPNRDPPPSMRNQF